ncbi:hypothetical protein PHYC_03493 [Phycisphaerales bacterium]|nr:hypothetical protein PHYC_03493 [Phycisphaerales bacterium]
MSATKAMGGFVAVLVVGGLLAAKVYYRYERVKQRDQRQFERETTRPPEFLAHAHELMDQAPDAKTIGPWLHTAVEENHDAALEKANLSSTGYRDAIIQLVFDKGQREGREDVMRSMEKVKTYAILAGEEWWKLKRKL